MASGVTPAGIRAGEPSALAGLVELRGSAVRAYAGAVAQEAALGVAAEAMAGFRAHVVRAGDVRGLNPDSVLLHAVRESSAARAPQHGEPEGTLRRVTGRGGSACELVPRLLAARANRELSDEDVVRLDRHLASCSTCRELRERFRTAESLYAEAAGSALPKHEAHALLVALAGAGPLADGTPQSVAQEALALLYADRESRQAPSRNATPPPDAPPAQPRPADPWPSDPAAADPRPSDPAPVDPRPSDPWPSGSAAADAPPAKPRPADPWPSDPWPGNLAAVDARPARKPTPPEGPTAHDNPDAPQPEGDDTFPDAAAAHHGARVGTTPGRVSFARRTVIIRSGIERSGPAATRPGPEQEPPAAEPEPASVEPPESPPEPEPELRDQAQADHPGHAPEAQQGSPTREPAVSVADPPAPHYEPARPALNGDRVAASEAAASPPAARTDAPAPDPASEGGPGAPPDSGAMARVVPGVLVVMAIGIALIVAGIIGAGNSPATSNDVEPPGLREPVRDQDTTGAPPAPPAPGSETPTDAN